MNFLCSKAGRLATIGYVLLLCSGCGYLFGDQGMFRDTSEDYKKSPEKPKLVVPEGKDQSALQDIYIVPAISDTLVLSGEFEVPRPTPLIAGGGDEVVRIQKLGNDSWALVNMAPGQLWPQVRSFVEAAGVQVARADARAGIMETNWLTLENASMASRFQFRIEQGVQRGNSELHVLQMNQAGDINQWPPQSDDFQQETDMLQGIAQYIANSADSASVSMIADQAMSASGKIALRESPDGPFIEVGLPYDRAWASLAKALTDSTFEITDRDRSKGEYYVKFLGPDVDKDKGWFGWLFDDDRDPLANRDFLVAMKEDTDRSVSIKISPVAKDLPFELRQEQALLVLIKGNIN